MNYWLTIIKLNESDDGIQKYMVDIVDALNPHYKTMYEIELDFAWIEYHSIIYDYASKDLENLLLEISAHNELIFEHKNLEIFKLYFDKLIPDLNEVLTIFS